jgi:hypothetical protein
LVLIYIPSFYVLKDPGSGAFLPPGSGIRAEKFRDPDPGESVHPGSATLVRWVYYLIGKKVVAETRNFACYPKNSYQKKAYKPGEKRNFSLC